MSDPKFVRLRAPFNETIVAHVDSGWSISGYDVLPFPEQEEAAEFVRNKLASGILEAAGKAEYQEVQDTKADDPEPPQDPPTHQEQQIIDKANAEREKLNPSTEDEEESEEEEEEEEEEAVDYSELTVDQLKILLESRELPTGGNKAELVARLEESDAEA